MGANLLSHIIPQNDNQPLFKVAINPPNSSQKSVINGIYARDEVEAGIKKASEILYEQNPDKIITIGGNCIVSLAPFDYLNGKYEDLGVIWLDAHPDVSTPDNGYEYAHAMVLGTLLGDGDGGLRDLMKNKSIKKQNLLYIGLQEIHDYQERYLNDKGIRYKIQDKNFVSLDEISEFAGRFKQILVHLDIDVLDAKFFHSTYFANPDLTGDGSGSGKMKIHELAEILSVINKSGEVVGLSVAEYLPFDEFRLHNALKTLDIFR